MCGRRFIQDIEKVVKYPNSAKDAQGRLLVAASVGTGADTFERVSAFKISFFNSSVNSPSSSINLITSSFLCSKFLKYCNFC